MYVVFYTHIERVHLRVIVVYITPYSSPRATNDILYFIQHNLNLLSSHYSIFYNIAMSCSTHHICAQAYLHQPIHQSPLMPPERLWIPRLALSRHNLAYFPFLSAFAHHSAL